MAFSVCFAQEMPSQIGISREKMTSNNIRGATFTLDEKLRELEKKKMAIEKLADYVPLAGAVDENEYIVGPGDRFTISIAGGVEEQYTIIVGADGSIVLPYTSAVMIAGSTLKEAKSSIQKSLATVFQEEDISSSLTTARLFIVTVVGMVNVPGAQTVSAVNSVHSAIEMAGGNITNADIGRVKLVRDGVEKVLDLTEFLRSGDLTQNPTLLDGDIVVVPGVDTSRPAVFLFGAGYSGSVVNFDHDDGVGDLMRKVGADREMIDISDIELIRDGEIYSVNLLGEGANSGIHSGDSIFFKTLPDSVYVGGRVTKGGSVPFIAGSGYAIYVAMAGGISTEGSANKVKVIRNGKKMGVRRAGDIRRGDVIMIGTSPWYVINEGMKSLGQIGSFASAIYIIAFRD